MSEWKKIRTEFDLPMTGGTRAVIYHGTPTWMYFNVDAKTWHPANGWRRVMGQPWNSVTAYFDLPTYTPFPRLFKGA